MRLLTSLHPFLWHNRCYSDSLSPPGQEGLLENVLQEEKAVIWLLSSGYLGNIVHRHLGHNAITSVDIVSSFLKCFKLKLCPDITISTL